MRIIYSSNNQKQALGLSKVLKSQGIENQLDSEVNNDWGSPDYGVATCRLWVIDEDSVTNAIKIRDEFESNPEDPKFKISESMLKGLLESSDESSNETKAPLAKFGLKSNEEESSKMGFVTLYILITCIMLFFFSGITTPEITKIPENIPYSPVISAPVNKILSYDYPKAYEITDDLINRFGLDKLENKNAVPAEAANLMAKINQTPYWHGFYDKIVHHFQHPEAPWDFSEPMFEKIKEGEIWRLITPILMHGSILHLAFNLILFVILGKQMEKKIGSLKFLIFVLITGIFSNTAQYLMSGTNFLGISGVICAMIGFVFMRQRYVPWEGYQFSSISLSSVVVFIILMLFLQIIAFLIEISFNHNISPGIANSAHLSGLFIGLLLGQLNYFKLQNER